MKLKTEERKFVEDLINQNIFIININNLNEAQLGAIVELNKNGLIKQNKITGDIKLVDLNYLYRFLNKKIILYDTDIVLLKRALKNNGIGFSSCLRSTTSKFRFFLNEKKSLLKLENCNLLKITKQIVLFEKIRKTVFEITDFEYQLLNKDRVKDLLELREKGNYEQRF